MSVLESLKTQFAIPVIRENDSSTLESICLALADGGLKVLEITLMSDAAYEVIKKLSVRSDLVIGAGTVLNSADVEKAIQSGAKFLVSPGLNLLALETAKKNNIPFYPGVLTPTEIMAAQAVGCELVKVFPISSIGGTAYLKSLRGPFPKMQWMVTGGVGLSDLKSYKDAGASAVGLGGNITPADAIKNKNWAALTELAQQHVNTVKGL